MHNLQHKFVRHALQRQEGADTLTPPAPARVSLVQAATFHLELGEAADRRGTIVRLLELGFDNLLKDAQAVKELSQELKERGVDIDQRGGESGKTMARNLVGLYRLHAL